MTGKVLIRIPGDTHRIRPKVTKICDVCSKEFITSFSNWKRCSKECSKHFHQNEYQKYIYPYGITSADYNRMFEEQEGCCFFCKRHKTEIKHKLNIDHCHQTGIVRWLLCNQCNQALGLVKEDTRTLKRMYDALGGES